MTCEKCGRDFDKGIKEIAQQMLGYHTWGMTITCACGKKQEYKGKGMKVEAVKNGLHYHD